MMIDESKSTDVGTINRFDKLYRVVYAHCHSLQVGDVIKLLPRGNGLLRVSDNSIHKFRDEQWKQYLVVIEVDSTATHCCG